MKNLIMYKKGENSWIRWIKKRIRNNLNFLAIAEGPTGIGKCQPKGSKVLMADGEWKNIEDIKKGDKILSPQKDGSYLFSKVVNITKWFSKENYDVCEKNKTKKKLYSCSSNHTIPVYHRCNKRGTKNGKRYVKKFWWDIKEYEAKQLFNMSGEMKNHQNIGFTSPLINKFKNRKNCEIEPYTLGVYLGDGMFSHYIKEKINKDYDNQKRKDKKLIHKRKQGRLSITSADEKIMEEISKHYHIMNIHSKEDNKAKAYEFSLNSDFANILKNYNLCNKKSGDKFIPKEALLSDSNYRKKLLAGLIDTDGYYGKKRGGYSFTLKSKRLIEDIKSLIYSIGGRCGRISKVTKTIKSIGFVGEYYNLNFYLGNMELPLKCKRKKRDVPTIYLNSNRIAINLKKSYPCNVYGFTIDSPSSYYITDNWMVTHNSWTLISMAYMIDSEFETRQIAFGFKQVMSIINSDWFNKKKWKIIIFDEAQCDISNRSWQSLINRLMNYLLSTFRHRNIILLFTSPYSDFLDSQTMKLMHVRFEVRGHSRKTKKTKIRPTILQYNSMKKKFYYHSLFHMKGGSYKKIVYWYINKPPQHLIDPYEKDKFAFTDRLNESIQKDLEKLEVKDEDNILNKGTTKQREAKRLYVKYNGDVSKVAEELGISKIAVRKRLCGKEKMADLDDLIIKINGNKG